VNGFFKNFRVRLALLIAFTVALAMTVAYGYWVCAMILFICWMWNLSYFLKYEKYYSDKVSIMLEAIENNDTTFKYPRRGISYDDTLINNTLNRITDILFQTKKNILQKEKYFESILESVGTGVAVINDKGQVIQTNAAALSLLGLRSFDNISQLRYVDESLIDKVSAFQAGNVYQLKFQTERREVNLSVKVSGMTLGDTFVRIMAFDDIKDELDTNEVDSWIRLTRVLTHEIMNSVTPITSLSDTLLGIDIDNADVREGLKTISKTGKNLINFVSSYRKFTHIPHPESSLFYVEPFLKRMIELCKYQTGGKNIEYVCDVRPSDLILYTDENLISQVVSNILKNAVEAISNSGVGGLVEISAMCDEKERVILTFANDGPLIHNEEIEHIFVPFYTTKKTGTGVGLSLARQIMRTVGGTISLRNDEKRKKVVVNLTFP
jgi:nitrogen fixation/metabolism regulation signal transduction histidine kinase